jgi:hypothetical protein
MKRLLLAALAVVREGIEDELVGLDEQRKGELATRVPEERRPGKRSGARQALW